jgi:putative exopolysaccharide biosynthesis protein
MENKKRDFIWNLIGTSINSFNSLFFMIVINHINLKSEAGVFTYAYSLMCLFFILATFYNRVYQISKSDKFSSKDFILYRVLSSILTVIIVFLFSIINGYNLFKLSVIMLICLFRMIEAISDAVYGVLQYKGYLYKSGISLSLKGIIGLIGFTLVDYFTKSITLALVSLIILNLAFFYFYDYKNVKEYLSGKASFNNILLILKETLPIFIYSFLAMYVANICKYMLDYFDTEEAQNIFGIIFMPSTVIGLCSAYIVVPIITSLNDLLKSKKYKEFNKLVSKMMIILVGVGVVAIIAAYVLGIPVLNVLYGMDLSNYKNLLLLVLVGATFYTLANVYSQVLVLLNVHKMQTLIYVVMSIVSTLICYFLISSYKLSGSVYSYVIFMFILLILYLILYFYTLIKRRNEESV